LPHAFVARRGKPLPLQTLTYGGRFVLIAGEDGTDWVEAARKIAKTTGIPLDAVTVGLDDAEYADMRLSWMTKREITRTGAVLVRPDRFIAFRSHEGVTDSSGVLTRVFAQILDSVELGDSK
jgi:2,4-dichlorophenol 6-monooxygenase